MKEQAHQHTPKQYRVAAAAFFFISGLGYVTWTSRMPDIQKQLHINDAQLGNALLALPVGLMLTMPVTKWLLTRYSSRAVMLWGSLCLCVILALIGVLNSYWQLLLLMPFFGSARNLMTLSINTQGVTVQGLYSRSIMASFHGIWSTACLTASGIALLIVRWNVSTLWHFEVVSIMLVIMCFYFIQNAIYQKPDAPLQETRQTGWWTRVYVLPDKHLLKYALICFACMACENTMYDWSELYVQKIVTPDKTMVQGALVIFLVAVTAGRFFGDGIVNRIGIKKVLRYSGILVFLGFTIAVAFPFIPTVALGFILIGLGVSCVVPMVFSLAGKSKHMSSSSALASISTVGYLGFILIPPFVGHVAEKVNLRLSFAIVTFLGLVIVYLVSKIKEDSNYEKPQTQSVMEEL